MTLKRIRLKSCPFCGAFAEIRWVCDHGELVLSDADMHERWGDANTSGMSYAEYLLDSTSECMIICTNLDCLASVEGSVYLEAAVKWNKRVGA